jgi:hypothetical protein
MKINVAVAAFASCCIGITAATIGHYADVWALAYPVVILLALVMTLLGE